MVLAIARRVPAGKHPHLARSTWHRMALDKSLLSDCVHCGFCLPACPTYVLGGQEADSPRGRIHLMEAAADRGGFTPTTSVHIDRCLGCLACVSACPSGVRYDRLIETARDEVERSVPRSRRDNWFRQLLFMALPHPGRLEALRSLLMLYERLGIRRALRASGRFRTSRLGSMDALLPPLGARDTIPPQTPAAPPERLRVGLLTGCVQRVFVSEANTASVRVLAAEGCSVAAPKAQGCCGALDLHAGQRDAARRRARALIDTFQTLDVSYIVVNAAGCGAAMKEYGQLLADDPHYARRAEQFAASVRDFSELLAEIGPQAKRLPLPALVTYQDACHLLHAQRIRLQPRTLLQGIPKLELREPAEPDMCCGSAGIYNLVQPDAGRELGDRKARTLKATGSNIVITANPGCLLQLRAAFARFGEPVEVLHVAEVLDRSIRGVP